MSSESSSRAREHFITGVLVVLMLLTGTINTIATKYQDIQCVKYNEKGECVQRFEHFAVQVGKVELTTILVSGPRRPLIIPFVADAPFARSYRVRKCSWERCSA